MVDTVPRAPCARVRAVLWRHVPNKVTLLHEQLRNNFKVELRWLPLTESTQIFFCDSVPRAPRAHAIFWRHVPKHTQSNWRNTGATSKWNYDGFRWLNWLKFFNERAARLSRFTSRFGCCVVSCCHTCPWATSKWNYDGFRLPNWLKNEAPPRRSTTSAGLGSPP